jgi:hypothetical protein
MTNQTRSEGIPTPTSKGKRRWRDWTPIRDEYIRGNDTLEELAARYRVAAPLVRRHSMREHWVARRTSFRESVSALVQQLRTHARDLEEGS